MKLLITRNLGRGLPKWKEGEVVEATDEVARQLLVAGHAIIVPAVVEAVPDAAKQIRPKAKAEDK